MGIEPDEKLEKAFDVMPGVWNAGGAFLKLGFGGGGFLATSFAPTSFTFPTTAVTSKPRAGKPTVAFTWPDVVVPLGGGAPAVFTFVEDPCGLAYLAVVVTR